MTEETTGSEGRVAQALRRGILAILVLAFAGTLIELYLLEHYEDWKQWLPLALLAAGVLTGLVLLVRPGAAALVWWRGVMLIFTVSGLLGTWFHYAGNVEFEIERTPELTGFALFRASMGGATPVLAPGTMLQFGLLGLLFAWRHPTPRRS